MNGMHSTIPTAGTTAAGLTQSQTQASATGAGNISFETVSNLYLSAMATQQSSANAGSGYPDLSVIAGLYTAAAGDDGVINNETELQNVLSAIESVTKIDLFEFDESGKNIGKNEHSTEAGATAATEKKGIDENGVLVATSCPLDPKREKPCTCKVTDGFASITDLFNSLANDTDDEVKNSVMSDKYLSEEEEKNLITDYLGNPTISGKLEPDSFGLTPETNEALNLLNQYKTGLDESNIQIIKDYLETLAPDVRNKILKDIYGDSIPPEIQALIPIDTSSSMMNPQKTGTHARNNRNSNDTTQ